MTAAERGATFLRNCRRNVTTTTEALDHHDFKTVAFLGHGMSGAGGMFGYQTITDVGTAMELAADREDLDASRQCVADLIECLKRADEAAL
jgi:HPt (histidine-containing phosphotransfer) domain-containing protein